MSTALASEAAVVRTMPAPLRVLMGVPAAGTGGGPSLHVPMLVQDLRRDGNVAVIAIPYGRWAEGEHPVLKVLHQVSDLLRYPLRVWRARPDVVHLNTSLDRRALVRDSAFVLCTRLLGKPIFLKWHGSETHLLDAGGAWIWRFLARVVVRGVDVLGVLSNQEREQVAAFEPRARCVVVRNPIDPTRYERHVDLRDRHGLSRDSVLLLFISRLIPGKGLADVLHALAGLRDPRLQLLVIGDGPERQPAEQLVRELDIAASTHFVGRVDEARASEYYAGSDVLVFPSSLTEGFPMTLFQSVVAGLGIITTRLRAALDHLEAGKHCLYVEPGDPAGITAALQFLLADPARLAGMRQANRALTPRFTRTAVAAEYEHIYRDLAGIAPMATSTVGQEHR